MSKITSRAFSSAALGFFLLMPSLNSFLASTLARADDSRSVLTPVGATVRLSLGTVRAKLAIESNLELKKVFARLECEMRNEDIIGAGLYKELLKVEFSLDEKAAVDGVEVYNLKIAAGELVIFEREAKLESCAVIISLQCLGTSDERLLKDNIYLASSSEERALIDLDMDELLSRKDLNKMIESELAQVKVYRYQRMLRLNKR